MTQGFVKAAALPTRNVQRKIGSALSNHTRRPANQGRVIYRGTAEDVPPWNVSGPKRVVTAGEVDVEVRCRTFSGAENVTRQIWSIVSMITITAMTAVSEQ